MVFQLGIMMAIKTKILSRIIKAVRKRVTPKVTRLEAPRVRKRDVLFDALSDIATKLSSRGSLSMKEGGNLREGIQDKKKVTFTYTRKDGVTGEYKDIEPYEIKEGDFWGYHDEHGSIHRFKLSRLTEPKLTGEEFEPRDWDNEKSQKETDDVQREEAPETETN